MTDKLPAAEHAGDSAAGIADLAGQVLGDIEIWEESGQPSAPGERSAEAIRSGHQAVRDIDTLLRQLHALRGQLVSGLRQDEDIRAARTDAMLAGGAR